MLLEGRLSLADYQRAFWERVTSPGRTPLSPEASSAQPPVAAVKLAQGDERATAEERLAVYAFMYQSRLAEALASTFPRLAAHLGHERFCALSAAYAGERPSRSPSLRHFGAEFPGWLRGQMPEDPASAGLAALEWARADIFDAPDEATLDREEAQALVARRGAGAPIGLIGAHRLLSLPIGAAALWDAPGEGAARPAPASEHLVIWREDVSVYHRVVGHDELRALHAAARTTTLGALCEGEALRGDDLEAASQRVFGWLALWLADGLVARPGAELIGG